MADKINLVDSCLSLSDGSDRIDIVTPSQVMVSIQSEVALQSIKIPASAAVEYATPCLDPPSKEGITPPTDLLAMH